MRLAVLERLGSLVSIGMVGMLTLAAWLLSELVAQSSGPVSSRPAGSVSTVITQAEILQTNAQGGAQYQVKAPRVDLFNDGQALLDQPELVSLAQSQPGPAMSARADSAVISSNQQEIEIRGNAKISRPAQQREPALEVTSPWIRFDLNKQTAQTTAPVRVVRGASVLTGDGLMLDQRAETLRVLSNTKMILKPESE
ncbi:MAG: LPS export ABC transporter periplasmic protein LptC [Burkholderiaceae bacterium]